MAEAVDLSLSKLTRSDIAAMVTYVRSVKPIRSGALPELAGPASDSPKLASRESQEGKRMFEGNCASCHAWTGAGALFDEAQLTGTRAVNDPSATNVVQMIRAAPRRPAPTAIDPPHAELWRCVLRRRDRGSRELCHCALRLPPLADDAQYGRDAPAGTLIGMSIDHAGVLLALALGTFAVGTGASSSRQYCLRLRTHLEWECPLRVNSSRHSPSSTP